MNIYDISAKAGVSIATVSRVLNGSNRVSEATRRKILNIIDETGYTPGARRRKASPPLRTVGILCTTLLTYRNAVTADILLRRLNASGFECELVLCGTELNDKRRAVDYFINRKINALIIQGADFMEYTASDNSYIIAAASHFPIILLNAVLDAPGIYCAYCDIPSAVWSVTETFIKNGRQNPLFVFPSMSGSYMPMIESFKSTCNSNGIHITPEYIHLCPSPESAGDYLRSLIESGLTPDAAITADDATAAALLLTAQDAGLSVPTEFEAAGCGFSPLSSLSLIPFTSIDCRDDELCSHAVSCITALSKGTTVATRTVFPAIIKNPVNNPTA